jgi:hypothetical protein
VQYKTAFVLMHKLRQSLMDQRDETPLAGEVELDGGDVGGSVRPANRAEDRVDRRLGEHQNPDKRCILVMRETYPADDLAERIGAKRTLTFVIPRENQTDVGALAARFIALGTTISADESDAYDLLHGSYPMRRVNHQQEYRAGTGRPTTRRSRTSRVFAGCKSASTTTSVWPTSPTTPTRRPIVRTPGAGPTGRSSPTS